MGCLFSEPADDVRITGVDELVPTQNYQQEAVGAVLGQPVTHADIHLQADSAAMCHLPPMCVVLSGASWSASMLLQDEAELLPLSSAGDTLGCWMMAELNLNVKRKDCFGARALLAVSSLTAQHRAWPGLSVTRQDALLAIVDYSLSRSYFFTCSIGAEQTNDRMRLVRWNLLGCALSSSTSADSAQALSAVQLIISTSNTAAVKLMSRKRISGVSAGRGDQQARLPLLLAVPSSAIKQPCAVSSHSTCQDTHKSFHFSDVSCRAVVSLSASSS